MAPTKKARLIWGISLIAISLFGLPQACSNTHAAVLMRSGNHQKDIRNAIVKFQDAKKLTNDRDLNSLAGFGCEIGEMLLAAGFEKTTDLEESGSMLKLAVATFTKPKFSIKAITVAARFPYYLNLEKRVEDKYTVPVIGFVLGRTFSLIAGCMLLWLSVQRNEEA